MDKYNTKEKANEYAMMAWPISIQSSCSEPFYNFVKEIIFNNLKKIKNIKPSCLEVGFGSGKILYDIKGVRYCKRIVGVERSCSMLEIAKSILLKKSIVKIGTGAVYGLGLKNILLKIGDIQHLNLKTENYDFAVCINVLDRIPNTIKGISEICRIVKSGGILVIATAFDYEKFTTPPVQRLNYKQFKAEFEKNNCFVEKEYKTSLIKKIKTKEIKFNERIFVAMKLNKKQPKI